MSTVLTTAGIDNDEAREVAEFAEADGAASLNLAIGVKGSAHGFEHAPVHFGSIPAAGGAELEQSAGTEQIAGEGFDGDGGGGQKGFGGLAERLECGDVIGVGSGKDGGAQRGAETIGILASGGRGKGATEGGVEFFCESWVFGKLGLAPGDGGREPRLGGGLAGEYGFKVGELGIGGA
jgi:hypothetical protein